MSSIEFINIIIIMMIYDVIVYISDCEEEKIVVEFDETTKFHRKN